jgi:hypothetical protein
VASSMRCLSSRHMCFVSTLGQLPRCGETPLNDSCDVVLLIKPSIYCQDRLGMKIRDLETAAAFSAGGSGEEDDEQSICVRSAGGSGGSGRAVKHGLTLAQTTRLAPHQTPRAAYQPQHERGPQASMPRQALPWRTARVSPQNRNAARGVSSDHIDQYTTVHRLSDSVIVS